MKDTRFYFTTKKNALSKLIVKFDEKSKNVVIPINTKDYTKLMEKLLSKKFGAENILCYTGETSESKKKYDFANVNTNFKKYFLIYSPILTAGISFEKEHFDYCCVYFSPNSTTVETSRYILLRVRNIKSNKYYIAINKKYNNLPTTDNGINTYLNGLEHYIFAQQISDYPL